MTERQDYPTAPESFIANTGQEELLKERRNAFFEKILNPLGFSGEDYGKLVRIQPYELFPVDSEGNALSSYDKLTVLFVRESPVASVLETKHGDYLHFNASYLNSEMIRGLKKI